MVENVAVNITLPKETIEYLDNEAKKSYLSRATVARQLLLQHIDEIKIIQARRQGYTIRKISEMYDIAYPKVLEILHITKVDEEEKENDVHIGQTMQKLSK
jgi:hypothetical protein